MNREANVALGLDAHFRMEDLMDVLLVALLKTSLTAFVSIQRTLGQYNKLRYKLTRHLLINGCHPGSDQSRSESRRVGQSVHRWHASSALGTH